MAGFVGEAQGLCFEGWVMAGKQSEEMKVVEVGKDGC